VGARNIKPARDRIERSVVFANREVFGIFIKWFSGTAAYNKYSAGRYSRNTKFSDSDISRKRSEKKLLDSAEIRADQKKYGMARRSLYGRMVRIQNLSRSLAARDLPQKNAV
jgi:hypothetical protein